MTSQREEPGIEIGLGLFDLFALRWALALFCDRSLYALVEKYVIRVNFVLFFRFENHPAKNYCC